jgi:hypothetical protein
MDDNVPLPYLIYNDNVKLVLWLNMFVVSLSEWLKMSMSEWLLINANSAIFQPYLGKIKLIFKWNDDEAHFVLNQHANSLGFYSANSFKQQSADRHVAPLGHIILIPNQPSCLLHAACLAEKQQIPILVFGLTRSGHQHTI